MASHVGQTGPPQANTGTAPQPPPQPAQTQSQVDIDPIAKVKQLLLPRLKDSLVMLFKISGQVLHHNSLAEEGRKPQEGLQQQFERSLEEFYSISDQLDINLRLALEMHTQQTDSARHTPLPVTIPKSDGQVPDQQSVPYPQFLMTVKQQISCAKDIYDLLSDFVKKLEEKPT